VALGCFDSHDNGDPDENRADGGGDTEDERSDNSSGSQSNGETDHSDGENSDEIDIKEILSLPPQEGAKIAVDAVCAYFDACMRQAVSCAISNTSAMSGSGSSSQEMVNVRCEVKTVDMSFDECREEIGVGIQRGFECAEITPEQEGEIQACFSALNNEECVEVTEEKLREFEAAIARGEEPAIGMPDACLGLAEIFSCGDSGDDSDVDSEGGIPAHPCVPDEIAACTCWNEQKGTQTCMPDRTYSPCVCVGDVTPATGVAGMGGSAGVGGAVPISPVCVEGETLTCACADGSLGSTVCLDGSSFSDCQCAVP
jgi:hypothetical protein